MSSCSFISSSLARSSPYSCTWSFSRPFSDEFANCSEKLCSSRTTASCSIASKDSSSFKFFPLVLISLNMVFPHVLSLSGKERTLTTYPWQNDIWYRGILSWSSFWRNSLTQVYSSWIHTLLQERIHVLCFFQILILNGDSYFLFLVLACYSKCQVVPSLGISQVGNPIYLLKFMPLLAFRWHLLQKCAQFLKQSQWW